MNRLGKHSKTDLGELVVVVGGGFLSILGRCINHYGRSDTSNPQ